MEIIQEVTLKFSGVCLSEASCAFDDDFVVLFWVDDAGFILQPEGQVSESWTRFHDIGVASVLCEFLAILQLKYTWLGLNNGPFICLMFNLFNLILYVI